MWRVLGAGWTKPAEDWVAVEPEDAGTLYHVYNILTGAVTHKPEWTDGKQVLKGKVLQMDAVSDRLSKDSHSNLTDVASGKIDLENVTPFSEQLCDCAVAPIGVCPVITGKVFALGIVAGVAEPVSPVVGLMIWTDIIDVSMNECVRV